jgi:hypothetical protein
MEDVVTAQNNWYNILAVEATKAANRAQIGFNTVLTRIRAERDTWK